MSKDNDLKYGLWKAYNLGEEEYRVAYGSYLQKKKRQLSKHKAETNISDEPVMPTNKKKRKEE